MLQQLIENENTFFEGLMARSFCTNYLAQPVSLFSWQMQTSPGLSGNYLNPVIILLILRI
jgi:hypothetical protein